MKNLIIFSFLSLVALNSSGTELKSDSTQATQLAIENSSLNSASAPDIAFYPPSVSQDYNAVVSQVSSFGAYSREVFKMPIQLNFGLEKRLVIGEDKRFSVGLGAGLLIVNSTFSFQNYNYQTDEKITRSYLTVPLYLKYEFLQDSRIRLYATSGVSSEFGLSAKIDSETYSYGELESSEAYRESLNSSQLNVNIGSGLNVKLAKHFSLFTEASVAHYFLESRNTVWSDKNIWFSIKSGINVQF